MKKSATGVSGSQRTQGTDQHQPAHPLGALGGQFRRQQAAVGVAHDKGTVEAQGVQQFLVEEHQVPQVVQMFQPVGLGDAGVGRSEDVELGGQAV